ncbi:hypothetical protein D6855_03700 [Butyrivibrio sp. CB08]|uniref:hypothetical protein n=1 Tax=Butyrivibrio sp. CB08 TaxID=2364879 RepID=UPI000EA9B466|nr:hypothetical protein [Butyrivibrio sp. CB08]RKM61012.1 hypothetical protein D6855_03700 [Butyrivibrio sp. CB08]
MNLQSQLSVIDHSCRVRILDQRITNTFVVFDSYKALAIDSEGKLGGNLDREYLGYKVLKLRMIPEINHKRAKELGLIESMHPEDTPAYSFSDLELRLYYEITIEKDGATNGT